MRKYRRALFLLVLIALGMIWFTGLDSRVSDHDDTRSVSGHQVELTSRHLESKIWSEPYAQSDSGAPGEKGAPVHVPNNELDLVEQSYAEYGFNQYVSDKISLHRSIEDTRQPSCHSQMYPAHLPKASIIIIFHNEGWSSLLRTVHSVIDRSPAELLHEVVLVDDFSHKEHLGKKLEEYISHLPNVKLFRTSQREGLIRARSFGFDHITGEVAIFLDAHCEVNKGWLPPLLGPIAENRNVVTCPIIDIIDHSTFSYRPLTSFLHRGSFNWRLDYKEKEITEEMRQQRHIDSLPVKSGVMAGGLFAIHRDVFNKLGKYDPGMYVWGGEQYELSFKIWMCGGEMLNVPCSRVGHVYRRNVPYTYDRPNAFSINLKRLAEVWMDDYKNFLYMRQPHLINVDPGDISERKQLREDLKCRSFEWFLRNVINDTVKTRFEPDRGLGPVTNPSTDLCIDSAGVHHGHTATLNKCHGYGGNQAFQWSHIMELRQKEYDCLDGRTGDPDNLYIEMCHETGFNQKFEFKPDGTLFHAGTQLCVAVVDRRLGLRQCNSRDPNQHWTIPMKDLSTTPSWAKAALHEPRPVP